MVVKGSNYLFLVIIINYCTGLEICEDHYIHCPESDCGSYPLKPLYLHHCMKTCGVCTNTNRALGKPTAQVTTKDNHYSVLAVDANPNTDKSGSSCSKTNETNLDTQWWCVDLQTVYSIDSIKIYNLESSKQNLRGFKVRLGLIGRCDEESFSKATTCFTDVNWVSQSVYTVNQCNAGSAIPLTGRFVFISTSVSDIQSTTRTSLALCEVGIYTGTKCNSGYYTYNETTCLPCDTCSQASCDMNTGSCIDGCTIGFRGDKCTECLEGQFGRDCRYVCNITQCWGNCDKETGTCSQCKSGYYGPHCSQLCNPKCKNGACSQIDGSCLIEKIQKPVKEVIVGDDGMDRTAVGIVGVICGVVITFLVVFLRHKYNKRKNTAKVQRMQPAPKPALNTPEMKYIPNTDSLSCRYIQVTELDNYNDRTYHPNSQNVPRKLSTSSFGNDMSASSSQLNKPRRMSSYSVGSASQFGSKLDKVRRISETSINNDSGYVPSQSTHSKFSGCSIEMRPPLELPGSDTKETVKLPIKTTRNDANNDDDDDDDDGDDNISLDFEYEEETDPYESVTHA